MTVGQGGGCHTEVTRPPSHPGAISDSAVSTVSGMSSSPFYSISIIRSGFCCSALSTRSTDSRKHKGWLFPGNRDSFCSSVGRTDIVAIWRRLLHGDSGVAYTSFEFFASSLCARTVRYGQIFKDRAHGSDGTNDSPFSASITRVSYLVVFFGKPRCSRMCSIAILLLFVFHLSFSFFLACLLFSLVWEPFTNTAVSSGMNFSQGTWMPTIFPAGQTADQIFAIDGYGTACLCIKYHPSCIDLRGHRSSPSRVLLIFPFASSGEGTPAKEDIRNNPRQGNCACMPLYLLSFGFWVLCGLSRCQDILIARRGCVLTVSW